MTSRVDDLIGLSSEIWSCLLSCLSPLSLILTDAGKRSEADQQSRICSVEGMEYRGGEHETLGSTCNGERFIKCVPSYHRDPSEWEDLADFIECSPEKDYFSWLKNRNKFNKWKQEKSALFKIQKRNKKRICIEKSYDLQEKSELVKGQKRKKRTYVRRVYDLRSGKNF